MTATLLGAPSGRRHSQDIREEQLVWADSQGKNLGLTEVSAKVHFDFSEAKILLSPYH